MRPRLVGEEEATRQSRAAATGGWRAAAKQQVCLPAASRACAPRRRPRRAHRAAVQPQGGRGGAQPGLRLARAPAGPLASGVGLLAHALALPPACQVVAALRRTGAAACVLAALPAQAASAHRFTPHSTPNSRPPSPQVEPLCGGAGRGPGAPPGPDARRAHLQVGGCVGRAGAGGGAACLRPPACRLRPQLRLLSRPAAGGPPWHHHPPARPHHPCIQVHGGRLDRGAHAGAAGAQARPDEGARGSSLWESAPWGCAHAGRGCMQGCAV